MKKFIYFVLLLASLMLSHHNVSGQNSKIAVVHGGVSTFHSNLNAAVSAAVSGDTIYLPGGPISTTGTVIISKPLTIVGAGHYPDSTLATNQTLLSTAIYIITGADSGSISGIKNLNFSIGNNTANSANITNYRIERCFITALNLCYGTGNPQNILVAENIINSSVGGNINVSVLFIKNIWGSNFGYSYPATFINNIFYTAGNSYSGASYFKWGSNSTFNNNVIIETVIGGVEGGSNCIYNNNLFCRTSTSGPIFYCGSSNSCNNNIDGQVASATFENAITTGFAYANNYHLKSNSPGVNAGTDGTDMGIYGTSVPYKESAVPFNPHISSKSIGTATSPTGTLNVDVKVVAQDR